MPTSTAAPHALPGDAAPEGRGRGPVPLHTQGRPCCFHSSPYSIVRAAFRPPPPRGPLEARHPREQRPTPPAADSLALRGRHRGDDLPWPATAGRAALGHTSPDFFNYARSSGGANERQRRPRKKNGPVRRRPPPPPPLLEQPRGTVPGPGTSCLAGYHMETGLDPAAPRFDRAPVVGGSET